MIKIPSIFRVRCDGDDRIVEAPDMATAVTIWRAAAVLEFGDDYVDADPDSVERLMENRIVESELLAAARDLIGGHTGVVLTVSDEGYAAIHIDKIQALATQVQCRNLVRMKGD